MSESKPPIDNPFLQIPVLLKEAASRMPAPLVIILAVSATVAILVGVALELAKPEATNAFLPLRIAANANVTLDESQMVGFWGYQDENLQMTLQMRNGGFEWLLANPANEYTRYYTRGSYKIEGDVIILQQRDDFGAPVDLQRLDVTYLPSTLRDVNIRVSFENNKMIWRGEGGEIARLPLQVQNINGLAGNITWSKLSDQTPSIR